MNQILFQNVEPICEYLKDRLKGYHNIVMHGELVFYRERKPNESDLPFINDILSNHSKCQSFIISNIHNWYTLFHYHNPNSPPSPIDETTLNNFISVHSDTLFKAVINESNRIKSEIEDIQHRIEQSRQSALHQARQLIDDKVKNNKRKSSRSVFDNYEHISHLSQTDKDMLWNEYLQKWSSKIASTHPSTHPSPQRRPKLTDTFNDKLNNYVVYNHDKLLTLDEFTKLTRGWPHTTKPIEEWYNTYIDKFYRQSGTFVEYQENPTFNTIAFKSPEKIKALQSIYPTKSPITSHTTSHFPLKQNIKQYQLHKVAKRYTYLIDLMFVDKLCYLIAINVNTKYLFAGLMNNTVFNDNDTDDVKVKRFSKASKDTPTYLRTLEHLIQSGMKVKYLSGDGESAFDSYDAWSFYTKHGITFTEVPRLQMGHYPDFMKREQKQVKTDPMHGSLGIIDRVIRTIRDMSYNLQEGTITPDVMNEIINQYNNAPHKTLSKYAGFQVSPKMVQEDPDLEEFIVRRILQKNYLIMSQPGFHLEPNTQVKVYNEHDSLMKRRSIIQPGQHHIVGFKNGLYEVIDDKNRTQLVPRYKVTTTI